MKLMKNRKYLKQKNFMKISCTQNYNTFYVEGKQELRQFYVLIPYGNVFCAGSSHVLRIKIILMFYLRSN